MVHLVIVGAASLSFMNAPKARALTAAVPSVLTRAETRADGVVAVLLPGLVEGPCRPPRTMRP
jgi:hypothetical protein